MYSPALLHMCRQYAHYLCVCVLLRGCVAEVYVGGGVWLMCEWMGLVGTGFKMIEVVSEGMGFMVNFTWSYYNVTLKKSVIPCSVTLLLGQFRWRAKECLVSMPWKICGNKPHKTLKNTNTHKLMFACLHNRAFILIFSTVRCTVQSQFVLWTTLICVCVLKSLVCVQIIIKLKV